MASICFLSDFGLANDFVGTCKGVMVKIAPDVTVIDLSHEVPSFDVGVGAEVLQHATQYMPPDAVYLAVVDPGVGTGRRGIAIRAENGSVLVGPDNGLLIPACDSMGGVSRAVELTNSQYHVRPVSNTFHGRDIFAPAAAHSAAGVDVAEFGGEVAPEDLVSLSVPGYKNVSDTAVKTKIIDVDRYGNARLSITQKEADLEYETSLKVDAGDGDMPVRYLATFGDAQNGELILVPDSHWRLSLSINKGNAAQALALRRGNEVQLERES